LRRNARLIVCMGLLPAAKNSAKNPAKTNERAARLERLRPASRLRTRRGLKPARAAFCCGDRKVANCLACVDSFGHEPDKIVVST